MQNLEQKIEAVLFWKGEPVGKKELAKMLDVDKAALDEGLSNLEKSLSGRGISLVSTADDVALASTREAAPLIEKLTKEELDRDLGKAGLETLSIVLYYGPLSRRDIDYIRGVNSTFILRHLLIRGLVERVANEKDQRSFLYKPTLDLLSHLGLSKLEDLPEFSTVKSELAAFENAKKEKETLETEQANNDTQHAA